MLKTKLCLATDDAVEQHLGLDWSKGAYMPFHTTRANKHPKGQRSGGGVRVHGLLRSVSLTVQGSTFTIFYCVLLYLLALLQVPEPH